MRMTRRGGGGERRGESQGWVRTVRAISVSISVAPSPKCSPLWLACSTSSARVIN